jgi:hypothetical protein
MAEHPEAQRPDAAEVLQAAFANDALFEKIVELFPFPCRCFRRTGQRSG